MAVPLTPEIIAESVARYRRESDRYVKLAGFVAEQCRRIVDNNAIRATVQWRAKDATSLELKLRRYMADEKRCDDFSSPADVFATLKDLAGVRITTYVESDRDDVVRLIEEAFVGPGEAESVLVDKKDNPDTFYRATHCQVLLQKDDLVGRYENLAGTSCEVQVCSLLAHAWNEIEHDLGYKPLTGDLSIVERTSLDALARVTQGGDDVINLLLIANADRLSQLQGQFVDVHDFVSRMRERFPDAPNFAANSGQLFADLVALELDTPQKIEEALLTEGAVERSRALTERLREYLAVQADEVVVVDPESSDRLLMLLLENRSTDVLERHPAGPGLGRPPRIASVARRFIEMTEAENLSGNGTTPVASKPTAQT